MPGFATLVGDFLDFWPFYDRSFRHFPTFPRFFGANVCGCFKAISKKSGGWGKRRAAPQKTSLPSSVVKL